MVTDYDGENKFSMKVLFFRNLRSFFFLCWRPKDFEGLHPRGCVWSINGL